MAIQANRPNNRVFLLLGVVLAALAFGGVLFALRQAGGGSTKAVVVAKTAINAGSAITADEVTTASVPDSAAAADAYINPADVVGKTISANVSANTQLVPALFQASFAPAASGSAGANQPTSVEVQLTKGFVAMTIPAAAPQPAGLTLSAGQVQNLSGELTSAGYYIQPGDHIDIMVDVFNGTSITGTRYAFQDIPVLRTGVAGSAANAAASVYLVEMARNQAEQLTSLMLNGSHAFAVRYVLRPASEWGKFANNTYTPNYLPSTGPGVPAVADHTVTPQEIDALFGH